MIKEKVALVAFTDNGFAVLNRIKAIFPLTAVYNKEAISLKEFVAESFLECKLIVFVGAMGIAIRFIAPLLKSKDIDPAVVVVDELANYAIPVISGHIGGANSYAEQIAKALGAQVVLTTATDINRKLAIDSWAVKNGCVIANINNIKNISRLVLKGEKVSIKSSFPVKGKLPKELTYEKTAVGVNIGLGQEQPFETTLNVIPKIVVLGVGCKKGTDNILFESFILETLEKNNISILAVSQMASIDLKANEPCILAFCEKYNIEFVVLTAEQLKQVKSVSTSSSFVLGVTGVDNVCERSAIYLAGDKQIVLPKTLGNSVTISIALKDWSCSFEDSNVIY